mgnify:CR=1 FL=1
MTDDHLVNIVLSQQYAKIKASAGFICVVPKGHEDNPSLVKQMQYARAIHKPFYIILQDGASIPDSAIGADIRITVYAGPSEQETECAVQKAISQLREDFPAGNGKIATSPDISDLT